MSANYTIIAQAAANDAPATNQNATQTTTTQPAGTPDAPQEKPGFLDGIGGMLPMILIIVVMFYLMWRGQKKEQKKRQDMISSVKKGDKIVTIGGIHGVVSEIHDDYFKVEIAKNTEIEIAKSAVASVVNPAAAEVAKK